MVKMIYRIIWKALTYGFLFGNSIVFTLTFIMAFLNDYEIIIAINNHGEAYLELILLAILWIMTILYFVVEKDDKNT